MIDRAEVWGRVEVWLGVFLAVCLLVTLAVLTDLWDGLWTSRRLGRKIRSHKLRKTLGKVGEYFRFLMMGFLVDCVGFMFGFYVMPFVALAFGMGLIVIEARSIFEHARRRRSGVAALPGVLGGIMSGVQGAAGMVSGVGGLSSGLGGAPRCGGCPSGPRGADGGALMRAAADTVAGAVADVAADTRASEGKGDGTDGGGTGKEKREDGDTD